MSSAVLGVWWNGQFYRSRVEARWAMLFTNTDTQFVYDPEGYDLGQHGRYLPDFWLPEFNLFVEIKADKPTEQEREKAAALAEVTGKPVALMHGQPSWHFGELFGVVSHGEGVGKKLEQHPAGRLRFVLMEYVEPCWERPQLYAIDPDAGHRVFFTSDLTPLDRVTDYRTLNELGIDVCCPGDHERKQRIMRTLFWQPHATDQA
jgi:hypothetical protein